MRAHYEITVNGRREHFCGSIETAAAYIDERFSDDEILSGDVRLKAVDQFNIIIKEYKEKELFDKIFSVLFQATPSIKG